ncbi:phosphotransferase [Roseivivax marinus]|uniref:phosphotransferase n=1 Tax=Roseivivax marinus TaxID=1379903 RepID=UPI001587C0BB|nr:phosphotransferase [Roseivivax marinus]
MAELLAEAGLGSGLQVAPLSTSQNKLSKTEIYQILHGTECVALAKRQLGQDALKREAAETEACITAASVFADCEGMSAPDVLAVRRDGGFLLRALVGTPANLAFSRSDRALRSEQIRRVAYALGILHRSEPVSMAPYTLGKRILRVRMRLKHFRENPPNWEPGWTDVMYRLACHALTKYDSISGKMRCQTVQHGDLTPGNILINSHHVGLVDFEHFGRNWQVNDAATLLDRLTMLCPFKGVQMSNNVMFDPADVSAFAEGYGEDPTTHKEFDVFACFELVARIFAAAERQSKEPLLLLRTAKRALNVC